MIRQNETNNDYVTDGRRAGAATGMEATCGSHGG